MQAAQMPRTSTWELTTRPKRLAALGARVRHGPVPGAPFVVEDRELLTAQDPFSARAFAEACAARLTQGNT